MLGGIDFPQFLDADAIGLWITPLVELVARNQLLAQMTARALGKQCVLRAQFHAQLEFAGGLAFFVHAQIASGHANHRTRIVIQNLCGSETGEDFHAQVFGLLRKPAHDIAKGDDVVAVVLKAARQHPVGYGSGTLLGQEKETIFRDWCEQRCTRSFPVWEQFRHRTRIHHCARENVRAGFAAFFKNTDADLAPLLFGQLLESYGS